MTHTQIHSLLAPAPWAKAPEVLDYFQDLTAQPIEDLVLGPQRLERERIRILDETQSLAFHNYSAFIKTAHSSRAFSRDVRSHESICKLLQTCGFILMTPEPMQRR